MRASVAAARAAARETVWAQRAEVTGAAVPAATAAGSSCPAWLDVDASIVICHSEKESAAATFKHTFGYHPVRREALSIRAEVRDHRRRPVAAGR